MKCARCPLYTSWNNESDSGEACRLFGDSWDNQLQYEDKEGAIVGCYVDRHFIERADNEYDYYVAEQAAAYEEWMLETEG